MLGVERAPTRVDDMILPPVAHDVKVISIGMFVPGNQPVVWRGPMLHRALEQFLTDVFWGDLDVLLLDLPPGTGDIAISTAQLLPGAEILVVTTPQAAAAEVAERAGSIALQTKQHVVGVIENMSWMELPDGSRVEVFGSGGGQRVADSLGRSIGAPVPLLGQIPLDVRLREGGDSGLPVVLASPRRTGGGGPAGGGPPARSTRPRPVRPQAGPHPRRPVAVRRFSAPRPPARRTRRSSDVPPWGPRSANGPLLKNDAAARTVRGLDAGPAGAVGHRPGPRFRRRSTGYGRQRDRSG
jgi:hypothetical protein